MLKMSECENHPSVTMEMSEPRRCREAAQRPTDRSDVSDAGRVLARLS